jgi:hypothetical protein
MTWGLIDLVKIEMLLSGRPDSFDVLRTYTRSSGRCTIRWRKIRRDQLVRLSTPSRCDDLRTVEEAATSGPGGTCINRPPETMVDRTLHFLPPITIICASGSSLHTYDGRHE